MLQISPLANFGQVPIQAGTVLSCFPDLKSPEKKIQALEKTGELIRLKRGLYVVNPLVSGKDIDSKLCANHIYGPSYVSCEWALRWYGLIPEQVYTITSITTKHSCNFQTPLGLFSYLQVPSAYFPLGVRMEESNGVCSLVATAEKALCDTILYTHFVPSQSITRLAQFLEEDLRLDMDALQDLDADLIRSIASVGRKESTLINLAKLIERIKGSHRSL